jgi:hypothetical protein
MNETPPRRKAKRKGEEDSIYVDYNQPKQHGSSGQRNGDSSGGANAHIHRVESMITFNQVDDFTKQSR